MTTPTFDLTPFLGRDEGHHFDRTLMVATRRVEMTASTASGVLPWGLIDNRTFLRCLHGVGLSAWRLGDLRAAKAVFTRMLWLNPGDHQGARFNLAAVEAGKTWDEAEGDEI